MPATKGSREYRLPLPTFHLAFWDPLAGSAKRLGYLVTCLGLSLSDFDDSAVAVPGFKFSDLADFALSVLVLGFTFSDVVDCAAAVLGFTFLMPASVAAIARRVNSFFSSFSADSNSPATFSGYL